MAAERKSTTGNFRSGQKPGRAAERTSRPQARGQADGAAEQAASRSARAGQPPPSDTGMEGVDDVGELKRHHKSNTDKSEAMQNAAARHGHAPATHAPANVHGANKANADASTAAGGGPAPAPLQPNLTFTAPRVAPEAGPAAHPPLPAGTTGNANLTSHINDPAMRRAPPRGGAGGAPASPSGISPLARDGATPADEDARLKQDAAAADERGRLRSRGGLAPREDVKAWHQAEENRQSDLPGKPRADLPELE